MIAKIEGREGGGGEGIMTAFLLHIANVQTQEKQKETNRFPFTKHIQVNSQAGAMLRDFLVWVC